jgi:hypothetical protein
VLDWSGLDARKVERAAQLLVREACGATSVDGSGGDRAQDLRLDDSEGLTIFEVKSFTKRLTSSQRRQITSSLQRAVDLHTPYRWVLVIPLNPSPAELAWFDDLRPRFPDVKLEWYGLDWLDAKIAGREDVLSYIEGAGYTLLRRARQHGLEREALTSGANLTHRMTALMRLGEMITPYWKWSYGDTPWGPGQTLVAQRPEAADEDPVQFTPHFSFPADDPEAQAAAERLSLVLRLGGDVEIPGRFVEKLQVTAASEATQRLLGEPCQQVSALRLISIPDNTGLPMHGTLVLEHRSGKDGLSVPFTIHQNVGGTGGRTLTGTDPSGLLEGRLELASGDRVRGRFNLTLHPLAGAYPHDVLPAIRFLAACEAGDTLHFRRGPLTVGSFHAGTGAHNGIADMFWFVAALELLQNHLGTLVPVPVETEADDVQDLMAMARALSGESAPLPFTGFSMSLRPGHTRSFLQLVPDQPGAIYGAKTMAVTLDGQSYAVSGLAFWAPNVLLANRAELEALAADDTADAVATFSSPDDTPVFLIREVEEPGPEYRRILDPS